jgi:hypothetical protein
LKRIHLSIEQNVSLPNKQGGKMDLAIATHGFANALAFPGQLIRSMVCECPIERVAEMPEAERSFHRGGPGYEHLVLAYTMASLIHFSVGKWSYDPNLQLFEVFVEFRRGRKELARLVVYYNKEGQLFGDSVVGFTAEGRELLPKEIADQVIAV